MIFVIFHDFWALFIFIYFFNFSDFFCVTVSHSVTQCHMVSLTVSHSVTLVPMCVITCHLSLIVPWYGHYDNILLECCGGRGGGGEKSGSKAFGKMHLAKCKNAPTIGLFLLFLFTRCEEDHFDGAGDRPFQSCKFRLFWTHAIPVLPISTFPGTDHSSHANFDFSGHGPFQSCRF